MTKVEKFKKDPYFLLHLYSDKEFRKMAPTIANHPTHTLIFPVKIHWFSKGDTTGNWTHEDTINLNRSKHKSKINIISFMIRLIFRSFPSAIRRFVIAININSI